MKAESLKKWFENYWYHYKFHTIVGLILSVIVIFTIAQQFAREKFDYSVIMYLSQSMPGESEQAAKVAFEQYGKDINGDGKVNVQVVNLSFDPIKSAPDYKLAQATTLGAELQAGKVFIYLTDRIRFEELDEKGVFKKHSFLNEFDGKAFKTRDSAFEEKMDNTLKQLLPNTVLPEMYISLRSSPVEDSKHYKDYNNAKYIVERIAKGQDTP